MSRFERRAAAHFFEGAFPDFLSWSLSSALARAGAFIVGRIVRRVYWFRISITMSVKAKDGLSIYILGIRVERSGCLISPLFQLSTMALKSANHFGVRSGLSGSRRRPSLWLKSFWIRATSNARRMIPDALIIRRFGRKRINVIPSASAGYAVVRPNRIGTSGNELKRVNPSRRRDLFSPFFWRSL